MAGLGNLKNLRLGIDLRYLQAAYRNTSTGGIGGAGVYTAGLWESLARLFPETELVALVDHGVLPKKIYDLIKLAPRHRILPFGLAGRGLIFGRLDRSSYSWLLRSLESTLGVGVSKKSISFDVLHILNQAPAPLAGRCPTVLTLYDLIPLGAGTHAKETLFGNMRKRYLTHLGRADRLVCISESTRRDAESYLNCAGKTKVIYPGVDLKVFKPGPKNRQEVKDKFNIETDYFIHVGVCSGRKNPGKLLEAMKIAIDARKEDFILLFVGPYTAHAEAKETILRMARDYGIVEKVIVLGDVTDEELAILYRNALALVFPSMYEGFGYPAVESLACGTRCIVSNTSSLPEAVGQLGILVDPTSPQEIARAMLRVVESDNPGVEIEGPRWAQRFTWDQAAISYMKIYQELASKFWGKNFLMQGRRVEK